MKELIFKTEDMAKVLNYLAKCPYADVFELVNIIQSGKPYIEVEKDIKVDNK
jgi:hypothetical protein